MKVRISKQVVSQTGKVLAEKNIMDKDVSVQFRDIELIVADVSGVPPHDFYKQSRKSELKFPRQICHYLAKEYTTESLASIGKYFGEKDHSTVKHSHRVISDLIDSNDEEIVELVSKSENRILNEFIEE